MQLRLLGVSAEGAIAMIQHKVVAQTGFHDQVESHRLDHWSRAGLKA